MRKWILLLPTWIVFVTMIALFPLRPADAYHPLITDDTGTQGKGNFQFEFDVEYGHDKEAGLTSEETTVATTLTYGLLDNLDIVVGVPYVFIREEDGETIEENGISDISLDAKYLFYEKTNFKVALKPGITIPTGDEEKGLGSGKVTGRVFLIIEKNLEPFTVYINTGYIRNENRIDERKDLWHISVAGEYMIRESLKVALDTGIETNPDKSSKTHPAFLLGGIVYSVSEDFDLSAGIKTGLNNAETDIAILGGITIRF